jgi:hypothetical protein
MTKMNLDIEGSNLKDKIYLLFQLFAQLLGNFLQRRMLHSFDFCLCFLIISVRLSTSEKNKTSQMISIQTKKTAWHINKRARTVDGASMLEFEGTAELAGAGAELAGAGAKLAGAGEEKMQPNCTAGLSAGFSAGLSDGRLIDGTVNTGTPAEAGALVLSSALGAVDSVAGLNTLPNGLDGADVVGSEVVVVVPVAAEVPAFSAPNKSEPD